MKSLIYDIETIPLSDARLAMVEPDHEAPGNLKDPAKIAEAIREKAIKWREKAALSPFTARVAMIGCYVDEPEIESLIINPAITDEMLDEQEAVILTSFWAAAEMAISTGLLLVSFNGHGFDIPFLVKRSWALNVKLPACIDFTNKWGLQLPWVDLMLRWQCGDKSALYTGLNTVAGFLGLGQKEGDCLQLRHQLEHEPEKATAYLRQDLELTAAIARRMGITT